MPRIGLLTDSWAQGLVRQALGNLRDSGRIQLETIEDFRTVDSLDRAVWGLINLVDVLVASASKNEPNIYYQIGLAHGLGKPVIVVEEGDSLRLPPSLASQRTLRVEKADEVASLAFRLEQAINEAQTSKRPFSGPRFLPNDRNYRSTTAPLEVEDFRSLFGLPAGVSGARFERWFKSMAEAVAGWELVLADQGDKQPDPGFDLVIWNSREDSDLQALGNPIAVECSSFNADKVRRTMSLAKQSGLKGVVLATTDARPNNLRRLVSRHARELGMLAITLDRDDLIDVQTPEQLVALLKLKVREFQFDGGA